jgi:hypothetical protein
MASSSFLSKRCKVFAIFRVVTARALIVELSSNFTNERDSLDACQSTVGVNDFTFVGSLLSLTRRKAVANDSQILSEWRDIQSHLVASSPKHNVSNKKAVRVLVAQAVAAVKSTFNRVESNMKVLGGAWEDSVKWALFHYDNAMSEWEKLEWYRSSPRIIMRQNIPTGRCKQDHFKLLTTETLSPFDYVWLMDDDIDLKFMNWGLYSQVLAQFSPLVTQPSILVASEEARTTSLPGLAMRPFENNRLVVVAENSMSEVMAPVISTKVWPALLHWISRKTSMCDSDVSMFWDIMGMLNKIYCKLSSILVINAAPVSHVDCRSNSVQGRCWHECGDDEIRSIDAQETALMKLACPQIPDDWLERFGCNRASVFDCAQRLRAGLGSPHSWSVAVDTL